MAEKLKIIPLGGLDEIGKNCTVLEYGKDMIVVDCGVGFPEDLSPYSLVLHCGGCMLNEREVQHRMRSAVEQGVPITNYGTTIAFVQGILRRSLSLFPELLRLLDGTERS